MREQEHELVAAITDRMAVFALHFSDQLGDPDEGLVTRIVTVRVVDLLEEVEVHREKRDGKVLRAVPLDLVLEIAVQVAPVIDAGQLVLEDEAGRILPYVLQEIDELAVLHLDRYPPHQWTSEPDGSEVNIVYRD